MIPFTFISYAHEGLLSTDNNQQCNGKGNQKGCNKLDNQYNFLVSTDGSATPAKKFVLALSRNFCCFRMFFFLIL